MPMSIVNAMSLPRPVLLNNLPVNQQVYRHLRKEIVECVIPPGSLLSEKETASRFGVSRQPVREAFIKLAESGLVVIRPQRGTLVRRISVRQVNDGRFIRSAIECAIARRAAENVTPEDLAALEQLLNQQKLAAQNQNAVEFLALDDQFHQKIAEIAGCPMAWETIENIKAAMDRVRFLTLREVSPPPGLIIQHYRIFDALASGNPDEAEAATRSHLLLLRNTMVPVDQQNPDWFEHEE